MTRGRVVALLLGVVVLAGAVVVTLVSSSGGAADRRAAATTPPTRAYDLSTPERAARSFADAAAAGDGEALLALTCFGHPECVRQQGANAPAQVDQAKQLIVDGVDDLAAQLDGATFGASTEGSVPGVREVGYRTPGMPSGERRALLFVQSNGDWLYLGSAGAPSGTT